MENNKISAEVAKKLESLDGQRRKFEEILEGVADYPAKDKAGFSFILNGLAMRLELELTPERLKRYYQYILDKCGDDKELWVVALDSIKLLWRAPGRKFMYEVKDLSVSQLDVWIPIAKGLAHNTTLTHFDHEDHI